MTPHSVLEVIDRLERAMGKEKFEEAFDLGAIDVARFALPDAVHFDFGAARPEQEHLEFANELLQRGRFVLPYPKVLFTSQLSHGVGFLAMDLPAIDGKPRTLAIMAFGAASMGDPFEGEKAMTVHGAPIMTVYHHFGETQDGFPKIRWKMNTISGTHRHRDGKPYDMDQPGEFDAMADRCFNLVMGLNTLLMSKDVETERVPAPERLNRKRARQGRYPIGERMIVRIKRSSIVREGYKLDDKRASPRMHWRRGHFRTLVNGTVIDIAPTIVMAQPGVQPKVKDYRILL